MEDDGLLSQDDINSALAEAGLSDNAESVSGQASAPADSGSDSGIYDSAESDSDTLDQAAIDAVLAEAGCASDLNESSGETAEPATVDGRVDSAGQPFDEVATAMAAAVESEKAAAVSALPHPATSTASPAGAESLNIPDLSGASGMAGAVIQGIDLLRDVNLDVKIELGRSRMLVDQVLRLGEGSVVELNKLAGDPVDVFVNERLVARGEVLVLNDSFCVRINDIVSQEGEED